MDIAPTALFSSIALGIGLAAASGLRIFVPLFITGIVAKAELITLSSGFDFLTSWPALIILGVATLCEVGAYYLPWIDNLLDLIATPAAVIAGILLTAAVMGEVDPAMKWAIAIIAGGGTAGSVQTLTVLARGASTISTGGIGNPVVSTAETGGAIFATVLALVIPVVAAILVLALILYATVTIVKKRRKPS